MRIAGVGHVDGSIRRYGDTERIREPGIADVSVACPGRTITRDHFDDGRPAGLERFFAMAEKPIPDRRGGGGQDEKYGEGDDGRHEARTPRRLARHRTWIRTGLHATMS